MSVADFVLFEFETSEDLENWAKWYKNNGPFPQQEINVFVKTGEASAFGIATYPNEEARETGGRHRDDLIGNSQMSFDIKEIVPLSSSILFEFIDGVLNYPIPVNMQMAQLDQLGTRQPH